MAALHWPQLCHIVNSLLKLCCKTYPQHYIIFMKRKQKKSGFCYLMTRSTAYYWRHCQTGLLAKWQLFDIDLYLFSIFEYLNGFCICICQTEFLVFVFDFLTYLYCFCLYICQTGFLAKWHLINLNLLFDFFCARLCISLMGQMSYE